jgi:hypothetical protein
VGFSALRLEPTWTALGQAAGLAAHLCLKHAVAPARVDVAELQTLLHERQASTIYFSDVPPGSKYYRAAQFFGTRGYFHHVVDPAQARYEALRPRFGLQYSYAVPLHAAELDRPLDDMLRNQWLESKPARCDPPQQGLSRGEFLAELYKCAPAAERERAGRIQ